MNSFQESKNELEAAIRYAENAISAAQGTIESMEFRQEMAKKNYQEQTGREQALERELEERIAEVADLKVQIEGHRTNMALLTDEVEVYTKKYNELAQHNADLSKQNVSLAEGKPTMPVIPKAVAIAIFREGVAYGVSNACDEIDNSDGIEINESEYCGDFEVSFSKYIDLSEHLDLDWMRDKVGDYDEASVIEALKNLCADKEFECRIHGVDDQEKKNAD